MLTTEQQALEKWCPFSQTGYGGVSLNRISGVERADHRAGIVRDTSCVASRCMAWRWSRTLSGFGHCGLAGTPVGDDAGARAEGREP